MRENSMGIDQRLSGGKPEEVQAALDAGADPNGRDAWGHTAMSVAAVEGKTWLIRMLAAAGGDLEAKDRDGWAALTHAAGRGQPEATKTLLDLGANPNAESALGQTALMQAIIEHNDSGDPSRDGESIDALLRAGARLDKRDANGHTPIERATERTRERIFAAIAKAEAETLREGRQSKAPAAPRKAL